MVIGEECDCSFGRDPVAALSFLLATLGRVVRCIFIFLKKENKGCRFHPSHDVVFIKVILVESTIFEA